MRITVATTFALLLLALMPAFALLRYEHAGSVPPRKDAASDTATEDRNRNAGDPRSMPIGPSVWIGTQADAGPGWLGVALGRANDQWRVRGVTTSLRPPPGPREWNEN